MLQYKNIKHKHIQNTATFTFEQIEEYFEQQADENQVSSAEIRKILGQMTVEKIITKYGKCCKILISN